MTITLQILCDGIPCGVPLSESAARAWLEFVQHVAPETAKAMVTAMAPLICVCLFWAGERAIYVRIDAVNKRRRYLAKRRRAEWNKLHIRALTSWSRLPKEDEATGDALGEALIAFAARLAASQVELPADVMQVLRKAGYGEA